MIVLAGLAASLALWDPLSVDERAHITRLTAQTAKSIGSDIEADLETRLLAQVRLAETEGWKEAPGDALSSLEWRLNCRLFLDHYSSYLSLQWLDGAGRMRWRLDRNESPGKVETAIAGTSRPAVLPVSGLERQRVTVSPTFPLPGGRVGLRVMVPVVRDGLTIGFLVGEADAGLTLERMLSDHSRLGYMVSVHEGPRQLFRTDGEGDGDGWAQEVVLPLPGTQWRIRVWPDAELLAEMRSSLPELAGALGGLLGSALLLTWRFGKTAQSRSVELRVARDQLELRVAERTAELRRANSALETQIVERARAEDALRRLSGRLLRLQDEERRRIARELHDGTTQMLGAVAINMRQGEQLARRRGHRRLASLLGDGTQLIDRATAEIRTMSHLLHPPVLDELGLEYVLPWLVDGFSKRSGISVDLEIPPELGRLPEQLEIAFFRITQEALSNVHRHSGSARASVKLYRDARTITLTIEDEGCGIPEAILQPHAKDIGNLGVGILGMRERVHQLGGQLEITGNRGTTVRAVLPLSDAPVSSSHGGSARPS